VIICSKGKKDLVIPGADKSVKRNSEPQNGFQSTQFCERRRRRRRSTRRRRTNRSSLKKKLFSLDTSLFYDV
jgi:hypothetical protein